MVSSEDEHCNVFCKRSNSKAEIRSQIRLLNFTSLKGVRLLCTACKEINRQKTKLDLRRTYESLNFRAISSTTNLTLKETTRIVRVTRAKFIITIWAM